jgi:hypothetical protein
MDSAFAGMTGESHANSFAPVPARRIDICGFPVNELLHACRQMFDYVFWAYTLSLPRLRRVPTAPVDRGWYRGIYLIGARWPPYEDERRIIVITGSFMESVPSWHIPIFSPALACGFI